VVGPVRDRFHPFLFQDLHRERVAVAQRDEFLSHDRESPLILFLAQLPGPLGSLGLNRGYSLLWPPNAFHFFDSQGTLTHFASVILERPR
jgi:hypothetical protein